MVTTYTWNSTGGGLWTDAQDWTPSGPPGSLDVALFNLTGSNYVVTIGASVSETVGTLQIKTAQSTLDVAGTLDITNAGAVTNGLLSLVNAGTVFEDAGASIADISGTNATILASGANSSLIVRGGGLNVGVRGTGLLEATNGGSIAQNGTAVGITAGVSIDGIGTIMVAGTDATTGASSVLQFGPAAKGITLGNAGTGTLQVSSGGTVEMFGTGGLAFGAVASGTGIANITGPNALLAFGATAGSLNVAQAGTGSLTVSSGGTVQMNGPGSVFAGISLNAIGSITVTGAGSMLNQGTSGSGGQIGQSGTGTLLISSGGAVAFNGTGGLLAGVSLGAVGTITVTGADSTLSQGSIGRGATIGQAGSGTLQVLAGGTVSLTGVGGLAVGGNGGSGNALVDGGTLSVANGMIIGSGSGTATTTGTLVVQNGGLVANTGTTLFHIGFNPFSVGSVTINGGTLSDANASLTIGAANASGSLLLENGGTTTGQLTTANAVINATGTGSALATVTGGLWTAGGNIVVGDTGAGTLALTGGVVNAGTNNVFIGNQGTATSNGSVSVAGATLAAGGISIAGFSGSQGTLTVGSGGMAQFNTVGVSAQGLLALAGGTLQAGSPMVLNTGAVLSGFGTAQAGVTNTGSIIASGGLLDITGSVAGVGGSLLLNAGATLELELSVNSGQAIGFNTGTSEMLMLKTPGIGVGNAITGFALTDRIEFNLGTATISSAVVSGATIALNLSNAQTYDLANVAFANGSPAAVTWGTDNGTGLQYIQVGCFSTGTRIATDRGETAIEALREGDLVRTAAGGLAPIVWIGHRWLEPARHPNRADLDPVRVCAGAFGPGLPSRDLLLSPDHAVFAEGVLIPIHSLVNGASIAQERVDSITYWHVELAAHDVLLAEGLPAESYLECGNRASFAGDGGVTQAHPDFAAMRAEAECCAPRASCGDGVDRVRARLIGRLVALGFATTRDAGLRVFAGPLELHGDVSAGVLRFDLPRGTERVRLVSRTARPRDLVAERDDGRMLGVAVDALRLDGETVAFDDIRLQSGWYAPEPGLRWSDGAAAIRTGTARRLELRLRDTGLVYLDAPVDRAGCSVAA